jgi:hypothetical protein
MRKIHRYKPVNNEEILVVKKGVTYRVLDLGGSKIEIRVKSPKELARDKNTFKKYKNNQKKT